LGILGLSDRDFEKEKYTRFDTLIEVSSIRDVKGEQALVFDDYGIVRKISATKFDKVEVGGDEMIVRKIVKYSPRTFWRFKTDSQMLILIMPEAKE
jgi:hypothetical protein